jgi:glycosyltransferase involved in cell wall biosynthesis
MGQALGAEMFTSVVIPTRNRAEKVRVCVASLLAQDYPGDRYEIIVVDDGSADGTAEVVQDLSPSVRVVRQQHLGSNAARNAGLRAARGDPVCFVDDDVEVPATWLARMVDGFGRNPQADAFAGPVRVRLEGSPRRTCPWHQVTSSFDLGAEDHVVPTGIGANMAIRRRAVRLTGPFDEWIEIGGADSEWFDRLSASGGRVVYVAGAAVWHRRTAGDLRPVRLAVASFRRGVATHRYFLRCGRRDLWRAAARLVPRLLLAALRERCLGALAQAAAQAGFAYGLLRYRWVEVPPPPGPTT